MKKGFTLLEMVIVLAVLTTIFVLAIPNIQKVLMIVESKGCDAQVKIIDSAILQYKLKHDSLPYSLGELLSEGLISEKQMTCQNGQTISIMDGQAYAN